ncbi:Aminodeoxyfutalosine nucleosidase [Dyadobacter sp. CECT 9275]|uniref:adenosylhomocysteine nucleosidase n=2 Tax=Dyadobacter helix TaxID=2822344 RepID=A0A916JB68_9BACT|nr:Aminodeoxyfutalosine nucleosidase [Dyadobacter sp. CECT 9275]
MSAMQEEILGLEMLMDDLEEVTLGMRTYFSGRISGIRTILVFSRWGKVAAATTVTTLILKFGITDLIFTGVAGGISPDLRIGDIVLGTRFIQHDMDARPIIAQYELPLHGLTYLEAPAYKIEEGISAIRSLLETRQLHEAISQDELHHFGIEHPRLFMGDIASGDKFFSTEYDKQSLSRNLPAILCVEMEGAAVAQVCYEHLIPYTILRTISDTADENSVSDFPAFIKNVSSKYSLEIIKNFYRLML